MELARKCSEIISDVSDGDCLHPYICISLSSGFRFTIHIFSDMYSGVCARILSIRYRHYINIIDQIQDILNWSRSNCFGVTASDLPWWKFISVSLRESVSEE